VKEEELQQLLIIHKPLDSQITLLPYPLPSIVLHQQLRLLPIQINGEPTRIRLSYLDPKLELELLPLSLLLQSLLQIKVITLNDQDWTESTNWKKGTNMIRNSLRGFLNFLSSVVDWNGMKGVKQTLE